MQIENVPRQYTRRIFWQRHFLEKLRLRGIRASCGISKQHVPSYCYDNRRVFRALNNSLRLVIDHNLVHFIQSVAVRQHKGHIEFKYVWKYCYCYVVFPHYSTQRRTRSQNPSAFLLTTVYNSNSTDVESSRLPTSCLVTVYRPHCGLILHITALNGHSLTSRFYFAKFRIHNCITVRKTKRIMSSTVCIPHQIFLRSSHQRLWDASDMWCAWRQETRTEFWWGNPEGKRPTCKT
jgi:hypothetical protein